MNERALAEFESYVAAYDPSNPRIALKIDHTLRVAALCERIARELGFPSEDVELAWLIGLLHDIGRFEQVRRFDTFNDAATVNHAQLGAEVLFSPLAESASEGQPFIRRFAPDDANDHLIRTAIELHSAFRLPEGLGAREQALYQILRDADKIDILKVNCDLPIEDIYGVPEQAMVESALSPECVAVFYEHSCLPRGIRRYPADIMLGHICFAWEIVYDESLAIMREQGHLRQMLARRWANPDTQEAFGEMAHHMASELGLTLA